MHAGHPFIVEAAVCLGGPRLKEVSARHITVSVLHTQLTRRITHCIHIDRCQGLNIFRYGNRSPLLLNPESDVVTHKAAEIKYATMTLHERATQIH